MDFGIKAMVLGWVMWIAGFVTDFSEVDWHYINEVTSSIFNIIGIMSIVIGIAWKGWKGWIEVKDKFNE